MIDASGRPSVKYEVEEQRDVPALSLVLAFLPMVPFVAGAVASWWMPEAELAPVLRATLLWGGAILAFLAGVRRGLTFRSPDGETMPQIATMFVLFVLAVAALLLAPSRMACALLIVGFACLALFDSLAARKGEAPPFFAKLRPVQMMVPIISLAVLWPRL